MIVPVRYGLFQRLSRKSRPGVTAAEAFGRADAGPHPVCQGTDVRFADDRVVQPTHHLDVDPRTLSSKTSRPASGRWHLCDRVATVQKETPNVLRSLQPSVNRQPIQT